MSYNPNQPQVRGGTDYDEVTVWQIQLFSETPVGAAASTKTD